MKIVFTPDWFLTNDILIEIFSFLILLLFFIFAFKSYKISKKKSVLFLGIGFLLIALAELSTIFTKLVLYYDTGITQEIGRTIINSNIMGSIDIFYYVGFSLNRLLTLLGLYVIYKLPLPGRISGEFFLNVYLITLVAVLSQSFHYIYNLTALFFLIFIINKYYKVYKKDKIRNTLILISAFVLLAVSQVIFIFSTLNYVYVTSKSIQLVSYIILLFLIIKISKDGKKKKQSRNNA